MSEANGVTTGTGYRSYYCSECGLWLFETNIPLGTTGQIRLKCPDSRRCGKLQAPYAGDPPRARPNRDEWLRRRQPRAYSTDRLPSA